MKITTVIDKKSTGEFIRGTFLFALLGLGLSILMIALYVIFGVLNNSWGDPLQIVLLILGAVLLLLSSVMVISYTSSMSKIKDYVRTVVYDFQDDSVSFEIFNGEERVEGGKATYLEIVSYKETKNYVYLRIITNVCLVVKKEEGLVEFLKDKGIAKHQAITVKRK